MKTPHALRAIALVVALATGGCAAHHATVATPADQPTEIFVVRHAERVSTTDRDSPLSETGHARARALADALADAGVDAVLTSQYLRTRQTAAPLAERLGLTPAIEPVESADASSEALARRVLSENRGETVLVVGHSNTVHRIVRALGGAEHPELTEDEYGDIFLVIVRPGGEVATVRTRFGAPH